MRLYTDPMFIIGYRGFGRLCGWVVEGGGEKTREGILTLGLCRVELLPNCMVVRIDLN
jgi:hypothetical protein